MVVANSEAESARRFGAPGFMTRRLLILGSLCLIVAGLSFWLSLLLIFAGAVPYDGMYPKIDFYAFWSASSLALDGAASSAYDFARLAGVQQQLPGNDGGLQPWLYPPVALFLVLPLSLLPFAASLFAWVVATGALALAAVRRIATEPTPTLVVALAFPATLANILIGQNGLLTAGLFAWGMLLLRDRPVAAGAILGLLIYKPQFFPLVVVALLAARQRHAAISCLATVAALSLASLALFGYSSWEGFVSQARSLSEAFYLGQVALSKIQSVSASLLLLGLPGVPVQIAQLVVSLACLAFVAWLWRGDAPFEYKAAGLALAALLASPHTYHYDLTLLGLAALWMAMRFQETGWRPWDKPALVLAWLTPLAFIFIGFPVTPIVILMLLAILVTRVRLHANYVDAA